MDKGVLETPYGYQDLSTQPQNTVRLLTVFPGTSDRIQCSLKNAVLDESLHFKALSYTWGTDDPDKLISIDSQAFRVRQNLWAFLKRLQGLEHATTIWIDAICVNQNDIPERNQQVRLMSQIYSQAEIVIVWLGEDPGGVLRVLETQSPWDRFKKRNRWISRLRRGRERRLQAAVRDLWHRPYWTRPWVVQEFLLAKHARFMFGATGDMSVEVCKKWIWYYKGFPRPLHLPSMPFIMAEIGRKKCSLYLLMTLYGHFQCSDPRDRLYAFLGLASEEDALGIAPDYSITMDELCTKFKAAFVAIGIPAYKCPVGSWTIDDLVTILKQGKDVNNGAYLLTG